MYRCTGASRSTFPASTSCMIARAVNGLAQRADDERRLRRDGPPGGVGLAEAAQVDDSVALHDPEGQAGDALRIHLRLDERVDRAKLRRGQCPWQQASEAPGRLGQKGSTKDQCREQSGDHGLSSPDAASRCFTGVGERAARRAWPRSASAATGSRAGRKRSTITAVAAASAAATRRPKPIACVKASPVVASRLEAASGGSWAAIALAAPTESSAAAWACGGQSAERAFDVVRVEGADERADHGHAERSRDHPRDGVGGGGDAGLGRRHRADDGVRGGGHDPAHRQREPEEPGSERERAGVRLPERGQREEDREAGQARCDDARGAEPLQRPCSTSRRPSSTRAPSGS